jgi:hypothetical protein
VLGTHGKLFGLCLFRLFGGLVTNWYFCLLFGMDMILEVVKLKSWSWLNAALGGFIYQISSLFVNPEESLGISDLYNS